VLTLYTTPVIYIFFDNLSQRFSRKQTRPETGSELGDPAQG
jgi:multidrug efflux pump